MFCFFVLLLWFLFILLHCILVFGVFGVCCSFGLLFFLIFTVLLLLMLLLHDVRAIFAASKHQLITVMLG